MLSKQQKHETVKKLTRILKESKQIVISDFAGLTMVEITELRRGLKKQGISYQAVKKTLLELAWRASGKPQLDLSGHKGSAAVSYSQGDPVMIAKGLHGFAKATKKLSILGGFLMGELAAKEKIAALAQIPSREVLLAQILQLILSPVSGLARVLDGISRSSAQKLENRN